MEVFLFSTSEQKCFKIMYHKTLSNKPYDVLRFNKYETRLTFDIENVFLLPFCESNRSVFCFSLKRKLVALETENTVITSK